MSDPVVYICQAIKSSGEVVLIGRVTAVSKIGACSFFRDTFSVPSDCVVLCRKARRQQLEMPL